MIFGFARHGRAEPARAAAVPHGLRLYAVGDIHGRLDLLDRLLDEIITDAETAEAASPGGTMNYLVFLGDYVDRGPDSAGVVERLAEGPPPGFGAFYLKGNHEAAMVRFLTDLRAGPAWLRFGGEATLHSYGLTAPDPSDPLFAAHLQRLQERLHTVLPPRHLAFLTGLRSSLAIGGYLFVHAGIRPGVPVEEQQEDDLLWIREDFLDSPADHGPVVVHGHTITTSPDVRPNRIGIDTGAYATNRLTCLVLEGTERRFLST